METSLANVQVLPNSPKTDLPPSADNLERDLKLRELEAKIKELEEKNQKSQDDRQMRKLYAEKAYNFAAYTISFWVFLFLAYFLSPPNEKPLNDTALAIFTTACTVNILAAFISIIKGLFPNKN